MFKFVLHKVKTDMSVAGLGLCETVPAFCDPSKALNSQSCFTFS